MTGAIRVSATGGPEVLRWETIELAAPGPGQVRLAHTAKGVGVVQAIGPRVSGLEPGSRVAYALLPGSYAEARVAPADRLIALPAHIADDVAAGLMLRGMTVECLVERCYPVRSGHWVLWHAVAGADFVINYRATDWVARVKELTNGRGVDVVYDGVGRDTCLPSLDCLKPTGTLVTFGNASGTVPPIEPLTLMVKGSLHFTRPSLAHYIASRADLERSAASVFYMFERGAIRPAIGGRYALADAATAHRDLEARRTRGSIVFTL